LIFFSGRVHTHVVPLAEKAKYQRSWQFTYETDYVLIKDIDLEKAVRGSAQKAGHQLVLPELPLFIRRASIVVFIFSPYHAQKISKKKGVIAENFILFSSFMELEVSEARGEWDDGRKRRRVPAKYVGRPLERR